VQQPPSEERGLYDAAKIRSQLAKWKERLLDLGGGNPLLGLNRSRVTKLRVTAPEMNTLFQRFAVDGLPQQLPFPRRLPKPVGEQGAEDDVLGERWELVAGALTLDVPLPELARRLKRVYDNARTTVEERGVTTLYLTFGVLRWTDPYLGESVSPLWMVPCTIERTSASAPMKLLIADEDHQLNPALALFLRDRHKLDLPEMVEVPDAFSLNALLAQVRTSVASTDWRVDPEVWLSTFTFESLVLIKDLEAMAEVALQNKLIAAFAKAGAVSDASEALGDDLDANVRAKNVVPILPTDSSQLEALTFASSGRHVVIHGPPGTGKSQTITALIADALGRGQKVLFVSAKQAALDVVHRRLTERGLDEFCLEAHSTKAGKTHVIEELRKIFDADPLPNGDGLTDDLKDLQKTREQLNDYVRALHTKEPALGVTPFQGIGRLAQLIDQRDLRFTLPWPDPTAVTRDELIHAGDAIGELATHGAVFDNRATHPWRGFTSQGGGITEAEQVHDDLRILMHSSAAICKALEGLTSLLPGGGRLTIGELEKSARGLEAFASVERLPTDWRRVVGDALGARAEVFDAAAGTAAELRDAEADLSSRLPWKPEAAVELLRPVRDRFSSWYQRVTPAFFGWRSEVRKALAPEQPRDRASILATLQLAERAVELRGRLHADAERLGSDVDAGGLFDPTALATAADQYRAAQLLRASAADAGDLQQPTQLTQDATRQLLVALPSADARLTEALRRLDARWPTGLIPGGPLSAQPLDAIAPRVAEVIAAPTRMAEWILLEQALGTCAQLGLSPFLKALGDTPIAQGRGIFERRFYAVWTSEVVARKPALASALGARREELIGRFRALDEKIRLSAVRHIRSVASGPARLVRAADPAVGGGEVGILNRELRKRRAFRPLRRLFAEIPNVLQALKPCMLMSPVSVSTYLKPGALSFDLVVFDEASQLPTPEAVPAILRARQVVVAGDANQLPPTSFFSASLLSGDDDPVDSDEAQGPLDSLLDDCVAIRPHFQESQLRWHYRSRDERLIKFSNQNFYEGRLNTFPSASTDSDGKGVRAVYVADGIWGRGKDRRNPREARAVAKVIAEQLEAYPERSMGVVSMNISQKEAIEDALREELAERPDLATLWDRPNDEPTFIKALEAVQGDERDTMIISVGYGRDSEGGLSLNFGPINQEGGWRRLNVLVTRAKWQTIIVTSVRSDELRGINPNNKGASALRNFIEYAEHLGEMPHGRAVVTDGETNDFEDAVREVLRERGLDVDAQVGASRYRIDLAIRDRRDTRRYILGVECDGATYHGSRTARDRDLLRHQVLRSMGWRLHRLWSTDWFRDRESAIAGILRSLEQAESTPTSHPVEAPSRSLRDELGVDATPTRNGLASSAPSLPPISSLPAASAGRPYVRYRHRGRADRRRLMEPEHHSGLQQDILEIVEVEGPTYETLLRERLKEIHDVGRAGGNIQGNVSRAVDALRRARKLTVIERGDGRVLSLPGAILTSFRVPADGVERSIEEIPPEEVILAIRHLVGSQFGMQRDRIPSEVAGLFGFARARAPSADYIREIVDGMVESNSLRLNGPNVSLA